MPTAPERTGVPLLLAEGVAIQLEDISVTYRVPRERVSGIKEYTIRWLQRRLVYEEFRALQNISFQVKRGEVFGIIGRNGSGKSTLLKVVARVLVPQKGRALVRGQVAPLLELGAGFQFELTGRENIYLNCALLGRHQKVTEALLPEIIEFAEIGDFIDAPLRTYSTGMVARLGFAVATALRPEILLVDEVLSVGDAQFQQKCLDRMYNFIKDGTTILFVSHSMATMQAFCDQAIWLDDGHAMAIGPVERVIQEYINPHRTEKAPLSATLEPASSESDMTTVTSNLQKYIPFPEIGGLYPATGNLSFRQGSVTGWVKLLGGQPHSHTIIFHSDDSRYVLYFSLRYSDELKYNVLALVARAGGNRRMLDPYFGTSNFPEVDCLIQSKDNSKGYPFSEDEWHPIAMTWLGYPAGRVRLFIDGDLIGETNYDSRYDDGRSLPRRIAIGMRPPEWEGELVLNEDGIVSDSRPAITMSTAEGGMEIKDLRLYQRALTGQEILALCEMGPPGDENNNSEIDAC